MGKSDVNKRPILIAAPPRSGTTMIAGLLIKHGVWVGRGRTSRYPSTNSNVVSENQDIKQLMKQAVPGYRNWTTPLPDRKKFPRKLLTQVMNYVPENTVWLVKTSWTLTLHHFWMDNFSEARWILAYRDPAAILDSMNRHPSMRKRPGIMKRAFIRELQVRQQAVADRATHLWVDVQAVSQQDETEIARLFDFVDISPDWDVIRDFIEIGKMKAV